MIEAGLQTRTVVWLPRFLSEERMRDVRRLVILDWLLGGAGERWTTHADHLSEVDRPQARAILDSQRTALRQGLRATVQESYGAAAATAGTLLDDPTHDRVLVSLDRSFNPASPVGTNLAAAFGNLIDQAFTATYPGHPRFDPPDVEISVRDLAAVYAHVERAVADRDGRVRLESDIATVRRVANALHVGSAGIRCPLFTVTGPPTEGSKITWAAVSTDASGTSWRLTGFGTGVGRDTSIALRRSVQVTCDFGHIKQVAVVVPIRIQHVVTLCRGVRQGEGVSTEVSPLGRGEELPFDVRTLSTEDMTSLDILGSERFDLTHDDSHSSSVFAVAVQMARENSVDLGVKAFGLEAAAKVTIRREQEATLEIELSPGHCYNMMWIANPNGITWSADGGDDR
jgi:hypothetical protein